MTRYIRRYFLTFIFSLEIILVMLIIINTIYAIYYEGIHLFTVREVTLTDILLMFLYLEVLIMIKFFIKHGKIYIKYPIIIAVLSLSRYITLAVKDIASLDVILLSVSVLTLCISLILVSRGIMKGERS
ncbi:phosphate-starvation-inducible PsiE family protein [Photobacterium makurazakiensis]|uniref:phosphate-starvation-inducible PsiE family protein n=1 Tax=Photobacterium makurazakiensis TaxID=2910234 RepID=UPI003D147CF7